jgi:type IV pilus assembly protein PilA
MDSGMNPKFVPATARAGFTLIELLVVVAIIGTLSAIAIPIYTHFKANAVDNMMIYDLRGARHAMEAFYEANGETYEGATEADLVDRGFRKSPTITLNIVSTTATTYTLRACTVGGNFVSFFYDSNAGTSVGQSTPCS